MSEQSPKAEGLPGRQFPPVSAEDWRRRVDEELDGADFDRALVTRLAEGIAVQPLYSQRPAAAETAGVPGLPPFVRGSRPADGCASWVLCPRHDHPDPAVVAAAAAADVAGGAGGLWLALDAVARQALRADDPAAKRLGRGGIAAHSLAGLDAALAGVELGGLTLLLDAGANALPAAAALLALLERRGVDPAGERLLFAADPLAALAADGALPAALPALEEQMAALAAHCAGELPHARAVSVSTEPYHAAGADAAQELGWMLATAVAYLRRLTAAGLALPAAAAQIALVLPVDSDLFLGIAKLRAARLLWSKALAACGVEEDTPPPWVHAVSSERGLTRRDPWDNGLRVTGEMLAAACGGADGVTPAAYDRALGQPGELGRRVARNTPLILAEESHLGRVADPGGGSYYLESLTDALGRVAWEVFRAAERGGGMAEMLASGALRRAVEESWEKRRRAITEVSELADREEDHPAPPAPLPPSPPPPTVAEVAVPGPRATVGELVAAAAAGAGLAALARGLAPAAAAVGEPLPVRRDAALTAEAPGEVRR